MLSGTRIKTSSRRLQAFSLADLIAVLAVVLVLAALQLPSAAGTRGKGQGATCLANHRQLVRAWQLYAEDNGGRLVGNLDGSGVTSLANSNKTWVLGWLDFNGGVPNGAATNTLYLTTYSPLAPYLEQEA
jgi:type II secretory pathway pseudopilin PulG